MGILVRRKNEQNNLGNIENDIFININLIELMKCYVESNQQLISSNEQLTANNISKDKHQTYLNNQIDEQIKISEELSKMLAKKDESYKKIKNEHTFQSILEINREYNKLLKKQQLNDLNISKTIAFLKTVSKRIENNLQDIDILNNKINELKSLINLEYQNVDWSKIKHSKFILSQSFEKIENNDIKLLLKQIVKKNYELEKTMVQLFYKLYNKTLKNNKCQKLYELINRTILLNSIINKVYEFTSKVVSNTDFVYETGILLQQMIKLLDILETYSLNILNEEKIFDVSNTIRNVKNVSELNNKIVQKNYRPIVLFKNRLNNYNLSYNILNIMIDEIEKYVMPISADEKVVQKIYSI